MAITLVFEKSIFSKMKRVRRGGALWEIQDPVFT